MHAETKVEKSRENTEASTIKSTLHGSPGSSLHTVDRNSNGYNNEDKNNDRSSNKRFKNPHYYSESSDYNFDHSSNYNHNNYTLFVSNNMNNNNNDNSNNNNLHRIHINHRRNTGHSSLLNLNLSFYYLTTCNLIYLIVYLSSSIPLHFWQIGSLMTPTRHQATYEMGCFSSITFPFYSLSLSLSLSLALSSYERLKRIYKQLPVTG